MISKVRDIVKIRVHWLPVYVPMTAVCMYLRQFGVVQACDWDYSKIVPDHQILTTVRNVVVELKKGAELPSQTELRFGPESFKMLTVPGRGPICFKCNSVGHVRSQCSNPYCRHCNNYNHSTEDHVI